MSFDWSEFLVLADYLSGKVKGTSSFSQEALQRSAVSRAYYAAFGTAYRWASAKGFRLTDRRNVHEELRNYLRRNSLVEVADNLTHLRRLRNQCDYDETVPELSLQLQGALARARLIVARFTAHK